MTPADAADFVVTHRAVIQRATAAFAKRYGLSREDAAYFAERVDAALSADDYRIICSFRGGYNPSTFITVAVWHVCRDFRDSTLGRDW